MSEDVMERLLPDSVGPSAEVEKAALREMQMAFHRRTTSAVLAMVSAALVLPCLPESAVWHLSALKRGGVVLASLLCLCSLLFCGWFICATMRLRTLGLDRVRGARGAWTRLSWGAAGSFVSFSIAATICAATGRYLDNYGVGGVVGLVVALGLGIRLKQVPTYAQMKSDAAADQHPRSIKQDDDQGNG